MMKDQTKIQLSVLEMEMVSDAGLILTKNNIIKKIKQLLEQVQTDQQDVLSLYPTTLPQEVLTIPPKISRGENYQGLPWLILDYPRHFKDDNIFAIRTMFWWGNFFSCTLHLSGIYKALFEKNIVASVSKIREDGFFICTNTDQWQHHFDDGNFLPISQFADNEIEELINKKPFLKLSKKIALEQWEKMDQRLTEIFRQYIILLSDQLPSR